MIPRIPQPRHPRRIRFVSGPNHYELLRVAPTASREELRQAFRSLSKRYHPDTTELPADEAERAFRQLRQAYPDLPILARARDTSNAAALYRAGASHAIPEALEASLQLSEAALVEIGVPMGPVIASIHGKRDEMRVKIMEEGDLDEKPMLRTSTLRERANG